jgi:hypothetical protein
MLRIRRGPSTNICNTWAILRTEVYKVDPIDVEYCRNDYERKDTCSVAGWRTMIFVDSEPRPKQATTAKLTHAELQRNKILTCKPPNSRYKVKCVTFSQHRKTVPNGWSCRRLSQLTEVFYDDPDCKNEGEGLPYCGGYQILVTENHLICVSYWEKTRMVAKNDVFLWILWVSLTYSRVSSIIKTYPLKLRCLILPW